MGTPAASSSQSLLVQFHAKLMAELGPASFEVPLALNPDSSGSADSTDSLKLATAMATVRERLRSTGNTGGDYGLAESGGPSPKATGESPVEGVHPRTGNITGPAGPVGPARQRRPSEVLLDSDPKHWCAPLDRGMLCDKGVLLDLLGLDLARHTRPAYDITNGDVLLASYLGLPLFNVSTQPTSPVAASSAAGEEAARLEAELAAERQRAAAAEEETSRLREAVALAEAEKEEANRKLQAQAKGKTPLRRIASMPDTQNPQDF